MLEIAGLALRYPDFEARYDLAVPAGALCAVIGIARFGSVVSRTVGALTAIAGLSLAFGG